MMKAMMPPATPPHPHTSDVTAAGSQAEGWDAFKYFFLSLLFLASSRRSGGRGGFGGVFLVSVIPAVDAVF